jgi:hypothetical protein
VKPPSVQAVPIHQPAVADTASSCNVHVDDDDDDESDSPMKKKKTPTSKRKVWLKRHRPLTRSVFCRCSLQRSVVWKKWQSAVPFRSASRRLWPTPWARRRSHRNECCCIVSVCSWIMIWVRLNWFSLSISGRIPFPIYSLLVCHLMFLWFWIGCIFTNFELYFSKHSLFSIWFPAFR